MGGLALLMAACLGNDAAAYDPTISTKPPATTATSQPPDTEPVTETPATSQPPEDAGPAIVDWGDPSIVADLGNGWTVRACEGDGPFLCVEESGMLVGTIEGIAFPVSSFDSLDPAADDRSNLATSAAGFHASLETDRSTGCGAGYGFERLGTDDFVLSATPGVFYGYVGTMPDGSSSELNLQYATIVGDQIVSLTAIAYDEGGCRVATTKAAGTRRPLPSFGPCWKTC